MKSRSQLGHLEIRIHSIMAKPLQSGHDLMVSNCWAPYRMEQFC